MYTYVYYMYKCSAIVISWPLHLPFLPQAVAVYNCGQAHLSGRRGGGQLVRTPLQPSLPVCYLNGCDDLPP